MEFLGEAWEKREEIASEIPSRNDTLISYLLFPISFPPIAEE